MVLPKLPLHCTPAVNVDPPRVGPKAARLADVLLAHTRRTRPTCTPSLPRIAKLAGCSERSARRRIGELKAAGFVTVRHRYMRTDEYTFAAWRVAVYWAQFGRPASRARAVLGQNHAQTAPILAEKGTKTTSSYSDARESIRISRARGATDALLHPNSRRGTARALAAVGVEPRVARELVRQVGPAACRRQLRWLPHRHATQNPAGYLVLAIREGYPEPVVLAADRVRIQWELRRAAERERERLAEAAAHAERQAAASALLGVELPKLGRGSRMEAFVARAKLNGSVARGDEPAKGARNVGASIPERGGQDTR